MCTIPDIDAALRELRRVLQAGRAGCTSSSTGWRRMPASRSGSTGFEPVQKRVFGGCHLTRPVAGMLARRRASRSAELDEYYEDGSPKIFGANSRGIAVSP